MRILDRCTRSLARFFGSLAGTIALWAAGIVVLLYAAAWIAGAL